MTTRTYILDTSVLLSDPQAMHRFAEHDVVVLLAVVDELAQAADAGGVSAREALWEFDHLRDAHGHLSEPIPVGDAGGRLHLARAVGTTSDEAQAGSKTGQMIALASALADEGVDVCVVSKSVPVRVAASAHGIVTEEYRAEQLEPSGWTGLSKLEIGEEQMAGLWTTNVLSPQSLDPDQVPGPLYLHEGFVLTSARGTALGRLRPGGLIHLVRGDQDLFGLTGLTTDQRIAIDILLDEDIGVVSLDGPPGSGKSALALSAGLESVLERRLHRRIMVFRPVPEGEDYRSVVFDTLGALVTQQVIEDLIEHRTLEVFPLEQIRGRALHDSFVIVDDAQALDQKTLAGVLSRVGQNTRVIFTHDSTQRSNLEVGPRDGIVVLVEKLKGHPLFAHITLTSLTSAL